MIFISGVIIQKLCTNKIRVIHFCPNCVSFLPENVHFFIWGGGGGRGVTASFVHQIVKEANEINHLI